MLLMPFQILGWWLRSVFLVAALAGGIALIFNSTSLVPMDLTATKEARDKNDSTNVSENTEVVLNQEQDAPPKTAFRRRVNLGWNRETAMLCAGVALLIYAIGGGWLSGAILRPHDPNFLRSVPAGTVLRLDRPDGTQLYVECYGKDDGIPLVLTHGWGLDSREWLGARRDLEDRFRIIVWDLPGLGRSKGPANLDWSLEKLAHDLRAVMDVAGEQPVILAGHSIGGMIILTYCRLFPAELPQRVAGLVLGQTTYKNPIETTSMATFYRAIQKPLLEPLCYLMIGLAPFVWLMNLWSYCNGSVQRNNHKTFFSGSESREQLDFISRYSVQSWPAVVARGLLGMFRFDASEALHSISVPTLVMGGERDTTCKPEASQHMAASIPRARGITLTNAEHGGVFEFQQRFVEAIHELASTSISVRPSSMEKSLRKSSGNATAGTL